MQEHRPCSDTQNGDYWSLFFLPALFDHDPRESWDCVWFDSACVPHRLTQLLAHSSCPIKITTTVDEINGGEKDGEEGAFLLSSFLPSLPPFLLI